MEALGVLVAAAAGAMLGALGRLAAPALWRGDAGSAPLARFARPTVWFVTLGAALLSAGFLRHVFVMAGVQGPGAGLVAGLGAGAFVAAPWLAATHALAGRRGEAAIADIAEALCACGAIGAVLGGWG